VDESVKSSQGRWTVTRHLKNFFPQSDGFERTGTDFLKTFV